ncbi:MAG: HEPN domain-containing protein [Candidatus Binatia bacterium]
MLLKAREHLGSAEMLFAQGRYRDAVSRAYYTVFSAMQASLGLPSKGKWEHPGLRGAFIRKLHTEGKTVEQCRELRKRLRFLHSAREDADYTVGSIDEQTAQEAIQLAQEILSLVHGGQQQ